jgi:esterase
MILNFERNEQQQPENRETLVLIHGLFGSLSNLGMLARAFQQSHDVIQIDVRNHGHSDHAEAMNYDVMAEDIIETLDSINVNQFSVIGHSMGGKIAMKLTEVAPQRLNKLIVLDIAPFHYQKDNHSEIFKALFAVREAQVTTRKEATEIMKNYIREDMVIQFLLKSFNKDGWLFNIDSLFNHYADIQAWTKLPIWDKSTLFIRGGNSPYIQKDQHISAIDEQFSDVQLETIPNAGHWLHAEKTSEVVAIIQQYLNSI